MIETKPATAAQTSDPRSSSQPVKQLEVNSKKERSKNAGQIKGKEKISEAEIKKPWINMFRNNWVAQNGMTLTYIPQIIEGHTTVQLEEEDILTKENKWKCALIAYVIGECPGYNAMNRYVSLNWTNVTKSEVYLHDEGYYIVKFQSLDDLKEILYNGPYTINNRPIILKQWSSEFDFGSEFLIEIPLWVTFPKLPLNCWGIGSLSRIASAIGVPLFADECTTKQTRILYISMLIEVNVTKAIPQQINVMVPSGRMFVQPVEFERKPKFCDKFKKLGHQCQATMLPKED